MKRIEDIMRLDKDHLIIDCCPRKDNTESPFLTPENDTYQDIINNQELNMINNSRLKYTLYENIGIIMSRVLDDGSLKIRCPVCNSKYEISKEHITKLYDHIIKDEEKKEKVH